MKTLILLLFPFVTMGQSKNNVAPKLNVKLFNGIGNHPSLGYRKLNWSDFRGKQTNPNAIAVSNSGGIYQTDCTNNTCKISAWSVFYPDSSYAMTRDLYILIHEQGHFDITEIFTRRFKKEMESWQGCDEKKANEVPFVAARYGEMREEMQQRYDLETKCSQDHSAQERWNKWIAEELKK
jgi:hypothetical protein